MYAWEQIQAAVDYIEQHIDQETDIQQLAELAALSPFYFQRLFKRLVKKPVGEYVKLRRLAKAAEILPESDERLIDVALSLGFPSHEGFTRAFKQAFGITPDAYRRNPVALNRMTKPNLQLGYVLIDEGVPLVTDGIVLEINRKALDKPLRCVGLSALQPISFTEGLGTESGVDELDALWRRFHDEKQAKLGQPFESEELGVALPSDREGFFRYFAGAPSELPLPEGYEEWSLEKGDYVVCTFEAESFEALVMDALYKAEQYLYNVWLKQREIATDMFCAERYLSHGKGATQMEVWLRVS